MPVADPYTGEFISWELYNPLLNQLIVHNTPSNLDKFEEGLTEFDQTPKQVSIESKFITIAVNDLKKIGFSWDLSQSDLGSRSRQIPDLETSTYAYDINGDGIAEQIPFYTKPDGTNVINNTITETLLNAVTSPGPGAGSNTFSLSGIITDNADGDTLRVTMDYINSLGETELLSAPRVTTMNRKPAVISDLRTEFFNVASYPRIETAAGTEGAAAAAGAVEIEYEQFIFGITFSVTPAIIDNDKVRLWLNPQVRTLDGVTSEQQTVAVVNGQELRATYNLPQERIQAVWTNVIVHDGDTLVLGGLISDSTLKNEERVPYLSDIPVLGHLFRGKSRQVTQSSLLIFVTVDIIDPTGARYFEPQEM